MTRIKLNIIIGIIGALFFLSGAAYVTRDVMTPFKELNHDSSIIKEIKTTYYWDRNNKIPQLDIYLSDKPYFIRLSDQYKKYWHFINNDSTLNKTIQYHYLNHILRGITLSNPGQLSIDDKTVYSYEVTNKYAKLLVGLFILFALILLIISYFNIKIYHRGTTAVKNLD